MSDSQDDPNCGEDFPLTYNEEPVVFKLYKRRWFMLFLFMVYAASNIMQYQMYTIITEVVSKFYNKSPATVTWTSSIYVLGYIIFAVPGYYLQMKVGIQVSLLLGTALSCLGAWFKAFSVSSDEFSLVLAGQSMAGAASVLIYPLIPKVAAVWFGPNEVGKASSFALFGTLIGIAIGYTVPPMLVAGSESMADIRNSLRILVHFTAFSTSLVMFLIFIFFEEEPPSPPSPAQVRVRHQELHYSTTQSLKRVLSSSYFLTYVVVYGINFGIATTFGTLINPIILKYYPDSTYDTSLIGMLIIVTEAITLLTCGYILDKYKIYRKMALLIYLIILISMALFTFTATVHLAMFYISLIILVSSIGPLMVISYELGVELTFPEPENVSGGVLNMFSQIALCTFMLLYVYLFYNIGPTFSNLLATAFCGLGLIVLYTIPLEFKRSEVQRSN